MTPARLKELRQLVDIANGDDEGYQEFDALPYREQVEKLATALEEALNEIRRLNNRLKSRMT